MYIRSKSLYEKSLYPYLEKKIFRIDAMNNVESGENKAQPKHTAIIID